MYNIAIMNHNTKIKCAPPWLNNISFLFFLVLFVLSFFFFFLNTDTTVSWMLQFYLISSTQVDYFRLQSQSPFVFSDTLISSLGHNVGVLFL